MFGNCGENKKNRRISPIFFVVAFSDNKPPAMQVELKIFRYKNVLLWYTFVVFANDNQRRTFLCLEIEVYLIPNGIANII